MVDNQVLIPFFGFILTLLLHNYQQNEDQIKKREKILEALVTAFNKLDQLSEGLFFELFKDDRYKMEPVRLELNFNFLITKSLVKLYFIKSEQYDTWIDLDNELDELLDETLPKYKPGAVKLDKETFMNDFDQMMSYLEKFIDLMKKAKFYNKLFII